MEKSSTFFKSKTAAKSKSSKYQKMDRIAGEQAATEKAQEGLCPSVRPAIRQLRTLTARPFALFKAAFAFVPH
jgi:hypothetical protein